LSMAIATGFTYTSSGTFGSGTGCFRSTMSATRTFTFGTTGGSAINSPILYLASGASIATLTTGSWFREVFFGSTSFTIATTTLNVSSIYSSGSTAVLAALTSNMVGSGSINTSGSIGNIIINTSGVTTTVAGSSNCSTVSLSLGTLNLNSQLLICSSTVTWNGGSLLNFGTLQCTTFTLNGPTFNLNAGTLLPTTSFVLNTGSFTYGDTATLGATPTFTQNAGTVTFNKTYAQATTGTYSFVSGTLTIADGATLDTGIFSSSNVNVRSIAFGSLSAGNINLTHTTAATVVLSMADVTNFTYTGPGGFTVANMANTRTLTYGTTAGSLSNAVNLTFTTGASVATLTTGSWFKNLDFGSTSFTIATTTVNIVNSLILSSSGTYTALTPVPQANVTYTFNNRSIGPLTGNASFIITLGSNASCTTFAMTVGTFNFATFTLTCSSTATYTAGTLSNIGTISCTTFNIAGAFTHTVGTISCTAFTVNSTLNLNGGTINPSTSFTVTSGSFTYNSGTLGYVPAFIQNGGTVQFNTNWAQAEIGISPYGQNFTFSAGTLSINDGITVTTNIFTSTSGSTRVLNFGLTSSPGWISVDVTAVPASSITRVNMANSTGLTINAKSASSGSLTGVPGGIRINDTGGSSTQTSTITCGTTGGTASNSPNIYFDVLSNILVLTTGSWFNELALTNLFCLTTASSLPATTINCNSLYFDFQLNGIQNISFNFVGLSGGNYYYRSAGGGGTTQLRPAAVTFNSLGTLNFNTGLTCSGAITYTAGTLVQTALTPITCTTWTTQGTFAHSTGTITPSTSFVITSGSYTQTGTSVLSAVPTFTQTAGAVTFRSTYSLTATGTYTLTAGTLTLGGDLTTGIFSSTGTGTRSIAFSTFSIVLAHTTAATTVLSMADITNFTPTGTGGFAADASITRTFTSGTTGGSTTRAPNLSLTGSGTAILTFTTGSWFNTLNFGTTAFAIAVTALNLNGLTLSSSGTYTNLTPTARGTGTFTSNGKTIAALVVDAPTYTVTTADALTITGALTLTVGALVAPYNITSGSFASAGPYSRSITGSTTTYTITGAGATAWNFGSTGSVLFNLANQRLSLAASSAFNLSGGTWTIEFWMYSTATPTAGNQCRIFMFGTNGTNTAFDVGYNNDGTISVAVPFGGVTGGTSAAGAITLNNWYHVAIVSNAGSAKIFINGTQSGSTTTITQPASSSPTLFIGYDTVATVNFQYQGYITNIRIVNTVAVYTGNFTTPTKPLLPTQSADTNISAITGTQTSLLLSTPINSFLTDYSNNNFTVTNTGTATANILSPFAVTSPGITFTSFTLSMTAATAKTFAGGGATYPTLNQGGAGALTISGNNSFGDLTATTRPSTITFTASSTQTFAAFTLSGTAGNLVTINSSTAATQATLSKSSGTVSVGFLSIRDSNATGGAGWYAGTTSTNVSNNTGWIFTAPPVGVQYLGNFFAFF